MISDVVIVGGGPVGLALAVQTASRGLSTVVLERHRYPVDKACGEGLMPAGVAVLERLGVRQKLTDEDASPFAGIRYVQEDGVTADGLFPEGARGLAIRRVALSRAMAERAREGGVALREGTSARGWRMEQDRAVVETDAGEVAGRVVVAADGLNSTFRKAASLEEESTLPRRYGVRRHYRREAWSDRVEVYFGPGAEAYVTPAGRGRVGVAFLWTRRGAEEGTSFEALLERFPALKAHLGEAPFDSTVRGAGPLARTVGRPVRDRFVLLGDSAGYVDAITGEGLTLGFKAAEALAELLPSALAHGAGAATLAPYVRAFRREFRSYAALTRSLLWIAERPALRKRVIRALARTPGAFTQLLRLVA